MEVFQQVTTAFLKAPQRRDLPPEVLARRRNIGALFRRLARKSLSQVPDGNTKGTTFLPTGSPSSGSPSKMHREEPEPDHKEMIDCGFVATEQTSLKPLEVLTVMKSSDGVLLLHSCQPHTLSSSSSSSPAADVIALPASTPPSLGGQLSFDRPASLCCLSSPDGNYLEIPALMSGDSSYPLTATSPSVRLTGSETENPQSSSSHPHISDLNGASPEVSDSASSRHPPISFPANPEISSLSENMSASESRVMWGGSLGKPDFTTGCQESSREQRAASESYYSISNFRCSSPLAVAPLNEPFLKESSELTAEDDQSKNWDSRLPSAPDVDQSQVDLPGDISDFLKDLILQDDLQGKENGVNHTDVKQTAGLNTTSSYCQSMEEQLPTGSDEPSFPNAKLKEFERSRLCSSVKFDSDSEQKVHDSPEATPTQTLGSRWDLAEESSCDPDDYETWLDGPAVEGVLLSSVLDHADTEGFVYWAEPVLVSVCSPVNEDTSCCESPDDTQHATAPPDVSSHSPQSQLVGNCTTLSPTLPNPLTLPSAKTSLKFSSCSLPSSFSSHIARRRDVPFATMSTSSVLSDLYALDTSTPFRAVQSWTELQIQRHAATGTAARRATDWVHSRKGWDGRKVWRRRRQAAPTASRCACSHQCYKERDSEKQKVRNIFVSACVVSVLLCEYIITHVCRLYSAPGLSCRKCHSVCATTAPCSAA